MTPKDDDDRERLSWREIDQRRDRGQQAGVRRPQPQKKEAERARQLALAQAEALFRGKRARPEYQKDLRQLEAWHGTKKFAVFVKKFVQEYGLPAEWGVLTLLLDYPEGELVVEALEVMAGQAGSRSRIEQQGFKGRLQVLSLTSPDERVRLRAEEILNELT
jgi:hypothetical protein